jgi:hypothetical protein
MWEFLCSFYSWELTWSDSGIFCALFVCYLLAVDHTLLTLLTDDYNAINGLFLRTWLGLFFYDLLLRSVVQSKEFHYSILESR